MVNRRRIKILAVYFKIVPRCVCADVDTTCVLALIQTLVFIVCVHSKLTCDLKYELCFSLPCGMSQLSHRYKYWVL
jgi:hypothetical protein